MDEEKLFALKIISPDRVFYEGKVSFVEMNTSEGEIGVYKNHVPMTSIIKPGIIIMHEEQEEKKAALHAGFVQILKEQVTVMAEVVEWPDEIDENRAKEAKIRAERRLSNNEDTIDVERAELALKRSLVRLGLK